MKRKRLLCAVIALVTIISSIPIAGAKEVSKHGFTYDASNYNVQWKVVEKISVYSAQGGLLGTMSYTVGLGRLKGSNDYILMTREVMTPNQSKVKIGVLDKGYGMSEYVSIKTVLPSLDNYSPQNDPGSDSVSLSLGADKEGVSVEGSYTITHSDLVITANCSTPDKRFYIMYDYKPHIANPAASNRYLAYESVQLGMAEFHTSSTYVNFTVNYDARFGAAGNAKRSPWFVEMNYVRQNTKSKLYSFSLSKL